mgnify:CR=1 FL=1
MLSTTQMRRVKADFDIHTGKLYLPEGIKLIPRDILQRSGNIDEVVALMKSVFELAHMPPLYVVTARRNATSAIGLRTYMLGEEDERQFLVNASALFEIGSYFPFYHPFNQILEEAGQ